MRYMTFLLFLIVSAAVWSAPASAQATRTWVSGVGDDANPCSRTAPCKTFAGAISKTAAGGEISVLDPGGFGSVTITKSISIVADGAEGGILAASTNGIVINAGVNDFVSIRGLVIEGATTGLNGIRIIQAGSVSISKTLIRNFRAVGTGRGIDIQPTAPIRISLKDVEINHNLVGINILTTSAFAAVFVDTSVLEGNTTNAMVADGAKAAVAPFGSRFYGTVLLQNGAKLNSYGNNVIQAGEPTSTLPLK